MSNPMALKKAEQIKHIAAEMVQTKIKDPRLGFVTITDVRLSRDGREATLFYTVLGGQAEQNETAAALDAAKGQIRTTVSKRLGMRFAPTITFVHDAMPETSAHFEELLAAAKAGDAEVAERAAAASYAGEPDPYKKKDDEGAETDE
jgi:ribosome-binding factor A